MNIPGVNFSDQFIKIMDAIGQKVGVMIDWTADVTAKNIFPYIKDLAHRIVMLEISTSIFWIVISLIMIAICVIVFRLNHKSERPDEMFYVFPVILIVVSMVVIACQAYDIIMAIYLPESIYLDYFNQYKYLIK